MPTQAEIIKGLDWWVPTVQETAGALDQFKEHVKTILDKDDRLQLDAAQKERLLAEWTELYDAHVDALQNLSRDLGNWDIPEPPETPELEP
jgi:hypothetical protein